MTLISAAGLLIQICFLCFLLVFVFAILGVSLFVGKFETCNDFSLINGANAVDSRDMCIGNTIDSTYGDSVLVPRVWSKYGQTFDNVGFAMATLFEVTGQFCDWPIFLLCMFSGDLDGFLVSGDVQLS